jgi:hypothetical protein
MPRRTIVGLARVSMSIMLNLAMGNARAQVRVGDEAPFITLPLGFKKQD